MAEIGNIFSQKNQELIRELSKKKLAAFDLIPHRDLREKLVGLVLNDPPRSADNTSAILLNELRQQLRQTKVDDVRVVVFGGGTGLSNIIGGDSRQQGWKRRPFEGLKQLFPHTKAVVCVTDDGGSTGELLKDLPVFALGDIRHVMLSSIRQEQLQELYDLSAPEALKVTAELSRLFNYRFDDHPTSVEQLLSKCDADLGCLPGEMREYLEQTLAFCFTDRLMRRTLRRSHCLGNLIICAVVCRNMPEWGEEHEILSFSESSVEALYSELAICSRILGAAEDAVLPCTATPAQLRFHYTDGVQVTGEDKSSTAQRGFPIDHVVVDFCGVPHVPQRLLRAIDTADILIMAPGSLYSSIIPVMQVPGIVEAVRANNDALKLLIANLWVQEGETDRSIADPDRKFHVSDMIKAYDRNLPGGTQGLFNQVLCMSLQDVPASVLQNYGVEGKVPIYLDREVLKKQGFEAIECGFFSRTAMRERQVIQHDPNVVAQTVKTLYLTRAVESDGYHVQAERWKQTSTSRGRSRLTPIPSYRYNKITEALSAILPLVDQDERLAAPDADLCAQLIDIIWFHHDIPFTHLHNIKGIHSIKDDDWCRDQRWDNVYSFYDPEDGYIKIRRDRTENPKNLEIALLIAIGQALLGDYGAAKKMETIYSGNKKIGRVYHLFLKEPSTRTCYFSDSELRCFLKLARMVEQNSNHFTRTINGDEGFTPPGLLMGLMYAWYLDNRFASHIEYKMSILKVRHTQLIPEQKKTRERRERLICFFRECVFGKGFQLV